jgi:hypothetical protein
VAISISAQSARQSDLKSADEAEESAIQEVEEKVLDIEKAALVPHLSWHFSDEGSAFDARIQDAALWKVSRRESASGMETR